jgi:regulator of ribonuclease activity A
MLDLLPDLYDIYPSALSLAQPLLTDYGKKKVFYGEIVTVACFNDNSKVKTLVNSDGTGKVMVVDGRASITRALLGDMLAEKAMHNGWQGIVINGCIRDAGTISTLSLGVKALGCCPIKTVKLGIGEVNIPISFAGLHFIPGQFIYGDLNGLAISETLLSLPVQIQ